MDFYEVDSKGNIIVSDDPKLLVRFEVDEERIVLTDQHGDEDAFSVPIHEDIRWWDPVVAVSDSAQDLVKYLECNGYDPALCTSILDIAECVKDILIDDFEDDKLEGHRP